MRSIPCATAGSRGCSTSAARRCLRGSSPSFRGPNGEGFCASQSRSACQTRASGNAGVRQRSICGRWARSRRRSHGARSSSMYLDTNLYTTRSAGLWPRSPRAETRNGSSAGSETDVGGSRPRSGASSWRPCGTANGCVRGVIHGLRRRPRGSIIGFGQWVLNRRRPAIARPNLRRGSAKPLLRGLTCSAEGRAGVGSGHQLSARRTPSEWTRPLPSRGVPTTIETARRVKAWHVVNPLRTPHKMGSERTCSRLEAVRSSPFRHPPYCLHAVVKVSAWRGENEKGLGKAGSEIVGGRIPVAVLAFRTLAFFAFDRLLDDALLDDRCGRVGRTGRRHRPAGLNSSRRSACDDRSTAGWPLIAHQRSALVADRGRHGVEGAAGRARLRAHLAHLLFLAEPVFEGEEGRLFAPPFLELGLAQIAAQLSGGLLLEAGDDLVVLEAHLLLVVRHLQLTGRELDAALRALLHVDPDPSLAVRALRHVPFELDAALRARRRVLRDEGTALAALDHLAEAVDFPVHRDAGHHRDGRAEDNQEEPPRDAQNRDGAAEERQGLLHRDRLGLRPDDAERRRDDDVVGPVRESRPHSDRAEA